MRKIKYNSEIVQKDFLNNSYPVRLGNGSNHIFQNRKAALNFLVATADFLEKQIIALNQICVALYQFFNDFWFYTDVEPGRGHRGYFEQEKKIRNGFNFYHEIRHDIFTMQFRKSATVLTFSYTNKLVAELITIIEQLASIIKNKSLSAHIFTLASHKQNLLSIDHTVNTYAHHTAASIDQYSRSNIDLFTYYNQKQA